MRLLTVFFLLLCCSGTCSQEERTSLREGFLARFFGVSNEFRGPPLLIGFFQRWKNSKEEDLHDFQKYGQEHTRPSLVDRSDWRVMEWWWFDKMTCCYSIKLLEYMYIHYIHISSYYTQNCVHGYRTCLCRVYAYAKYSTKKLIDLEFLLDVWCNTYSFYAYSTCQVSKIHPQHTASCQETKMLLFLLGLCCSVACVISLARGGAFMLSNLRRVNINFWPIYIYSDLELIRWKTAWNNFVCCILFIVFGTIKNATVYCIYLYFFKYLNGFWELNPLVNCMCWWLIAIELFFTTFMNLVSKDVLIDVFEKAGCKRLCIVLRSQEVIFQ